MHTTTLSLEDTVRYLSTITNKDHAGRHFTERYTDDVLGPLEADGFIVIDRPIHEATGIPYSGEHYHLSVTEDGQELVDAYPEYHDRSHLVELARKLGGHAADGFWEEFDESPTKDNVGDWDSTQWSIDRKELADAGAPEEDYDTLLAAWRDGFFGTTS